MKIVFVVSMLFLAIISSAFAQSCPTADSLFISQGKAFKPKIGYDKMTDSSMALVTYISKVPVFGDPGMMTMAATSPGKTLGDSTVVRMTVEFSQQGEGGV